MKHVLVICGFASICLLAIIAANSGPQPGYGDRALASCEREYGAGDEANQCAQALMAASLEKADAERMSRAQADAQ